MKLNRIKVWMLVALICCGILLGACNSQGSGETTDNTTAAPSGETVYRVNVVDANGDPYTSGVIVCFLQNGTQVAMQAINESGVAEKSMATGKYTVELVFTGNEEDYHYDPAGLELTEEVTELDVVLANTVGEGSSLYVGDSAHEAHVVGTGCTYVELAAGERNYLIFVPQIAGTYEFTVVGSMEPVGYYGSTYFVQSEPLAEVVDNTFTVSVDSGMIGTGETGTTVMVIGIDAGESASCVLSIKRIGDPEYNVANEPWHVYQKTAQLSNFTLDADTKIQEFDLKASTDTYNLVYNEADGFYHLDSADGPLVMVRLTEKSKYLDSIEMILSRSGITKYFYDAEGNFEKKESYTECLMEYIAYADETFGVYPLTEDLKYIIQQRGDYVGWWDPESYSFLFQDEGGNAVEGINYEIAWLFMCCYADVN